MPSVGAVMSVDTVLAAAPIVAVLVLMVGMGWSAVRAGARRSGRRDRDGPRTRRVRPRRRSRRLRSRVREGVVGVTRRSCSGMTLTVVAIIGPALAVHRPPATHRTLYCGAARPALSTPDPRSPRGGPAHRLVLRTVHGGCRRVRHAGRARRPVSRRRRVPPVEAVSRRAGRPCGGRVVRCGRHPGARPGVGDGRSPLELARATVPTTAMLGWIPLTRHDADGRCVDRARGFPSGGPPWTLGGARRGVAFLVPFTFLIGRYVGPELPTLAAERWHRCADCSSRSSCCSAPQRSPRHGRTTGHPILREPTASPSAALLRAGAPYLALVGARPDDAPDRHRCATCCRVGGDRLVSSSIDFTGTVMPALPPGHAAATR
jgi:lactate permease